MNDFLSQDEINALLQGVMDDIDEGEEEVASASPATDSFKDALDPMEKDALGEIGNISMGSAATALSQLLNQRVNITTPTVTIMSPQELLDTFDAPFMLIEVGFTDGLEGSNLLVLKVSDALIVADLMMGGDGTNVAGEVSELHSSAVAEAMNQMMGSAATSMSSLFNTMVVITTPTIQSIATPQEAEFPWVLEDPIVVVSFRMEIGNLIDSTLIQVLPARIAKQETALLMGYGADEEVAMPAPESPTAAPPEPQSTTQTQPAASPPPPAPAPVAPAPGLDYGLPVVESSLVLDGVKPRNLDLILDVPLKVSVVLGKAKRPIKEVLGLTPGSIVELDTLAEEPVDILINGTPIAKGEVVVINENFGIKITSIESTAVRINNMRK